MAFGTSNQIGKAAFVLLSLAIIVILFVTFYYAPNTKLGVAGVIENEQKLWSSAYDRQQ